MGKRPGAPAILRPSAAVPPGPAHRHAGGWL